MTEESSGEGGPGGRRRASRPFDQADAAHTVVRTAEALGWNLADPKAFLRKAQQVEFGLSAEVEFAALLRWLGSCRFVHRISEDVLQDGQIGLQPPDLLAVFASHEESLNVLIEVKTSEDTVLELKADYLRRLVAYSDMLSMPLLIGWRHRPSNVWLLLDPACGTVADDKVVFKFEEAIKSDLLSLLAGDFYVVPAERTGLRFEMERTSEKTPTQNGYTAEFVVRKAFFHDSKGTETSKLPETIQWSLLSAMKMEDQVDDAHFVKSFVTDGSMTRAQLILRAALSFGRDEQRIHWKTIGNDLNSILSRDRLLTDAGKNLGSFIDYIFLQKPVPMPDFIPENWRHKRVPDSPEIASS